MKICPKCNSALGVREILYGLPTEIPDENIFIVGGCTISEADPLTACVKCGTKWEYEIR